MTTFAQASEKLARRRGKYEKLAASYNKADRNTAERMLGRIDSLMSALQQEQEFVTAPRNGKQMGTGGWLEMDVEEPRIFDENLLEDNPINEDPDMNTNEGGGAFKKWASDNKDSLMNAGTSILDAAIRQVAIGSMRGPKAPQFAPYVDYEDKSDPNPELNSIERDTILRNRAIDKGLRDNNVIEAFKAKTFVDALNAKNRVFARTDKEDRALRREKLYLNNKVNMYNTSLANQHLSEQTDFTNNRASATANNFSNAITNYRLGQNDLRANKMDGVKAQFMSKQFEGSGVWERMMSDPAIASKMKEMFPEIFN